MSIQMNALLDCYLQKLVRILCRAAEEHGLVHRKKIQDILGTAVKGKLIALHVNA